MGLASELSEARAALARAKSEHGDFGLDQRGTGALAGSELQSRMSARCRSCNAEIIWAYTAGRDDEPDSSKRIPLDAKPIDKMTRGAFVLTRGVTVGEPVAIDANWFYAGRSPIIARLPALFISHFATCPNAAQHRKSR